MYKSTKDRYKDILDACSSVVHILSDLLAEDTDIHETGQVLHQVPSIPSPVTTISTTSRKQLVSLYGKVLSKMSSSLIPYPVVSDVVKLLWNWFDARFFKSSTLDSGFRYNIKRIPSWICDIVIVYSKHVVNNTSDMFIREFNRWCMSLCDPTTTTKFAIPYDVYMVDTSPSSCDMSLTAVVMWDMLVDYGLSELCDSNEAPGYLSDSIIYDKCGQLHPTLLDNYRNYKSDPNILLEAKVTKFLKD